jgi:hypothetical protein
VAQIWDGDLDFYTFLGPVPNAEPSLEGENFQLYSFLSFMLSFLDFCGAIFDLDTFIDATPNTLSVSEGENSNYTPLEGSDVLWFV